MVSKTIDTCRRRRGPLKLSLSGWKAKKQQEGFEPLNLVKHVRYTGRNSLAVGSPLFPSWTEILWSASTRLICTVALVIVLVFMTFLDHGIRIKVRQHRSLSSINPVVVYRSPDGRHTRWYTRHSDSLPAGRGRTPRPLTRLPRKARGTVIPNKPSCMQCWRFYAVSCASLPT